MKLPICLLLLCFVVSVTAQREIDQNLLSYRQDYFPEKVFVHTDKNVYAAGETIWLALYLVDGQTHQPTGFSAFARVDLVAPNNQLIQQIKLYAPEGFAAGTIDLPSDLVPGPYQMIAYTDYQRNTGDDLLFRKTINVIPGLEELADSTVQMLETPAQSTEDYTLASIDQVQLRFFPEGGECVAGLPCKVAVVASDTFGSPVQLKGNLYENGQITATFFQTNEYGMGQFTYTPKLGTPYQAQASSAEQSPIYELPPALEQGYALQVLQLPKEVQIVVRTNQASLQGTQVLVHRRGLSYLSETIQVDGQATRFVLSKLDLEAGVYVATVFDPKGVPMAERVFFKAPEKGASNVLIQTNKEIFGTRAPVELDLQVGTAEKDLDTTTTHKGQLSMSVLPLQANVDLGQEDIRSWFLLNSDLDMLIPNAKALLSDALGMNARDYYIDQFLMTRAWRRFRWKALAEPSNFQAKYPLGEGILLKGQMQMAFPPHKSRPGKVFFAGLGDNYFEERLTDLEGRFTFGPLIFFGEKNFILQGRFKPGKKNLISEKITIDDKAFTQFELEQDATWVDHKLMPIDRSKNRQKVLEPYKALSEDMLTISRNYDSLSFDLSTVDISAKRISKQQQVRKDLRGRYSFYQFASASVVIDSSSSLRSLLRIEDAMYQIPKITMQGGVPTIRGGSSFLLTNTPLFVLDGIEVTWADVKDLNPSDFAMIDVLAGSEAAIYGSRGGNGVVVFYTRTGQTAPRGKVYGTQNVTLEGFHKTREFATFDPQQAGNQNRSDIRTTIHWNPAISINKAGLGKDSFMTSDQRGQFMIIAQGLRADGMPVFGIKVYEVK
ncbi:MAG: MG2 domain-containing protein [Bacteroidota bacterium]